MQIKLACPSQRTIREWCRPTDGQPVFTGEAFSFSEKMVKGRSKILYCTPIVDYMSIRKHVELVWNWEVGNVDFGAGLENESLAEAIYCCWHKHEAENASSIQKFNAKIHLACLVRSIHVINLHLFLRNTAQCIMRNHHRAYQGTIALFWKHRTCTNVAMATTTPSPIGYVAVQLAAEHR